LEVADRLALVGSEARDVHEPDHLLRGAGDRDHRAAVGMADEHHRPVELVDQSLEIGGVVREPAKRICRRDHGVLVTVEEVVHRAPTRSVSEGAVNENNRWLGHETSFRYGNWVAMRRRIDRVMSPPTYWLVLPCRKQCRFDRSVAPVEPWAVHPGLWPEDFSRRLGSWAHSLASRAT